VAVVNEALAAQWLDGLEPIGARLLVDDNDGSPRPVEIVGVVGNVQQIALDGKEPTWDLYVTYPQIHVDTLSLAVGNMFWVIETTGGSMALAPSFVRELRQVDPDVVASNLRPLEHAVGDSVASRRFTVSLVAAFGLAALVLAVTGIYAVVTYGVSQRAREIGIRLALGARPTSILRLVVRQGVTAVTIGLGAGIALAIGAVRLVAAMLFGLGAGDLATFGQASAAVGVVSLLACSIPTIRALKRAPIDLRAE
jgi:ABC-type antimicrobial peptide transport system permease subunit